MFVQTEGNFLRQKGRGFAARVTIQIECGANAPYTATALRGEGWIRQGDVEEVPSIGYDDWKQGAIIGAEYALKKAEAMDCTVIITRIVGMTTDTNPTIVGAAAINAVWQALNYVPEASEQNRLEAIVLNSWEHEPHTLPNFEIEH